MSQFSSVNSPCVPGFTVYGVSCVGHHNRRVMSVVNLAGCPENGCPENESTRTRGRGVSFDAAARRRRGRRIRPGRSGRHVFELTRAGRRVIVVDQENRNNLGGQAFWSLGGLFLVDSPEQRRLGISDSAGAGAAGLDGFGRFRTARTRTTGRGSGPVRTGAVTEYGVVL